MISGLASSPLGGIEAFRWTSGTGMIGLGDLPGGTLEAQALAMSDDGTTIVGHSSSVNGQEAFRWTAGTGMVGLGDFAGGEFRSAARGASADGSVLAGFGTSASGQEAYRWTEAGGMVGIGDLPGGAILSTGLAISNDGTWIVGAGTPAAGELMAFRWSAATGMIALGDLPGGVVDSQAYAVSADGRIVGGQSATTSGLRAFVWIEGQGLFNAQNLLESAYGLDLGNWTLKGIRGISDDGLVWAGVGINPSGAEEGWIASIRPVPEPTTLTLLAAGLLLASGRRRTGPAAR